LRWTFYKILVIPFYFKGGRKFPDNNEHHRIVT